MEGMLYKGRPEDISARSEREIKVYDLLDSLGIEYLRVDHQPAATIELCHEIESTLGTQICKNLCLCNSQKTLFVLCVLPGDKVFKTKQLSPQLGCARLSFMPAEYMEELIGCTPGSASIFGLMNDTENKVRLALERELLSLPLLGFHPCINTTTLSVATGDILNKLLPAIGHTPEMVELISG